MQCGRTDLQRVWPVSDWQLGLLPSADDGAGIQYYSHVRLHHIVVARMEHAIHLLYIRMVTQLRQHVEQFNGADVWLPKLRLLLLHRDLFATPIR